MIISVDLTTKQVVSYSTTELEPNETTEIIEIDDENLNNPEFMQFPFFYKYENNELIKVPEYQTQYENDMQQFELNQQTKQQREADLLFNTVNTSMKIMSIEQQNANILLTLAKNGIV